MNDTMQTIADTLGSAAVDTVQSAVVAVDTVHTATEAPKALAHHLIGRPDLSEIVQFQLTGFVVVVLALSAMALVSWVVGKLILVMFGPYKPAPQKSAVAPAAAAAVPAVPVPTAKVDYAGPILSPSVPLATEATDEELVLIITSSVAQALGVQPSDVRILEIAHQGQAWRLNGRFNLHTSHQPR